MKFRIASLLTLAAASALLMAGCSEDNPVSSVPDTTPPLAPILIGTSVAQGSIGIWWADNTEPDLAGYLVYATQNGVVKRLTPSPLSGNTYTFHTEGPGTKVLVYLTATDWTGNESGPSANKIVSVQGDGNQHDIFGSNKTLDF